MPHLVIEYALDGKNPGYRFRPPTDGIDETTLKTVWRYAMPRGQGWGAPLYSDARSLKCFPLPDRSFALSEVVVTSLRDETGRGGIRRAEIALLSVQACLSQLEHRLNTLPAAIHQAADRLLTRYLWRRILDRALLRSKPQIVLAYPYTDPQTWLPIEALILKLVTSPKIRLIEGWGPLATFTTLALQHLDESRLVALPAQKVAGIRDLPVIYLPRFRL